MIKNGHIGSTISVPICPKPIYSFIKGYIGLDYIGFIAIVINQVAQPLFQAAQPLNQVAQKSV
jgi:hypothetical protein